VSCCATAGGLAARSDVPRRLQATRRDVKVDAHEPASAVQSRIGAKPGGLPEPIAVYRFKVVLLSPLVEAHL